MLLTLIKPLLILLLIVITNNDAMTVMCSRIFPGQTDCSDTGGCAREGAWLKWRQRPAVSPARFPKTRSRLLLQLRPTAGVDSPSDIPSRRPARKRKDTRTHSCLSDCRLAQRRRKKIYKTRRTFWKAKENERNASLPNLCYRLF